MRVLWTVNTVPPSVSKELNVASLHSISWVDAMSDCLKNEEDIELAIVTQANVKKLSRKRINGIYYYVMPKNCTRINYWEEIFKEFYPDIIHAYGTERKHNVLLIEKYNEKIPIVISLQGIISEYKKYYYAGIPLKTIIFNSTIMDYTIRKGIILGKLGYTIQSKYEKKMLKSIKYVEGRSDWDEAISKSINPNLSYYYCPRMIRKPFYNYKWDIEKSEKYTILVHQGSHPIKGLHFMIDALNILYKKYPNIKVYISGKNCFEATGIKEKFMRKEYIKILWKKIKKYNLEKCIEFTGYLDAEKMAKTLSEVNVCVIPSAIENAPNAIAEAMLVGTPIVASYVGGNAHMLNNGECGLLYCYDEPQLLAKRLEELFDSTKLADTLSKNARAVGLERHNQKKLVNQIKDIYLKIIIDFKKRKGEKDE